MAGLLIACGLTFAWQYVSRHSFEGTYTLKTSHDGIPWEKFSQEYLQELRNEGKPVFLDFTAAWCLTCKVNERTSLNHSDVVDMFHKKNIIALKAD